MKQYSLYMLFILTLIWAGCTDNSTSDMAQAPGVTDSTIVIGSWAPLSGPAAAWGAVGQGTDAYFKMINDEGGIHGRKIDFLLKDDQYQPAKTVAAVKEMAERDQVFAFTVGVGTAPGQAVKQYIIDNNIPWIGPASGSASWAYPPQSNVFSSFPLYFDEAALLVDYAVNELGKSRLGIIYLNDEYGKSGLAGMQIALEARGMEPVEAVSVELLDTDLSTQILKLQEANADAVLLWVTPKHGAIAVGTGAKLGFDTQWMSSSTLSDNRLMHTITEGLWAGTIWVTFGLLPTSDNPLMVKYRAAKEKYAANVQSETFFYAGILFAEPLVEALKQAGPDLSREKLIQALENLDGFQGSGGVITFGSGNRQGTRQMYIGRTLEDGTGEQLTDWLTPEVNVEEVLTRLESM